MTFSPGGKHTVWLALAATLLAGAAFAEVFDCARVGAAGRVERVRDEDAGAAAKTGIEEATSASATISAGAS